MEPESIPQECIDGNHNFGQAGRCQRCGIDRADTTHARFSGGAGARTHPLSDEDYRRQRDKLGGR
jgi:hypothetical protein